MYARATGAKACYLRAVAMEDRPAAVAMGNRPRRGVRHTGTVQPLQGLGKHLGRRRSGS